MRLQEETATGVPGGGTAVALGASGRPGKGPGLVLRLLPGYFGELLLALVLLVLLGLLRPGVAGENRFGEPAHVLRARANDLVENAARKIGDAQAVARIRGLRRG